MRAEDREVMAFKFRDLLVTVLPDLDLPEADGGTVGSCTSEHDRDCHLSLDILVLTPYGHIDPPYLRELRMVLEHALARSRVVVPGGHEVDALEQSMQPRTLKDVEVLERHLTSALEELQGHKEKMAAFIAENPGWDASSRQPADAAE